MSECGKTPTNPLGYPMSMYASRTHRDLAMALDRIAKLEQQLAEARKDGERLDWLENSSLEIYNPETDSVSCYDLRQAIDSAMKGQDDE